MSESLKRYVDSGSYDRGDARYRKTRSFWVNLQITGGLIAALGVVLVATSVNEYMHFNLETMSNVAFVGLGFFLFGLVPWFIGGRMTQKYKFNDSTYRLALHFMRDMKIKKPARILNENPEYLESFEEVRKAVTTKQAEYAGVSVDEQTVTRLSYRIASLVLRNEDSLALTSHLLSRIAGGADLDYDSLAAALDRKLETSSKF